MLRCQSPTQGSTPCRPSTPHRILNVRRGGCSMGAADEELVKVFVELRDSPFETESFWAKPLGGDLYELRNSPWYAYDLHFYDVVRAIPDQPDERPRITGVVRAGGHKTLRVLFAAELAEAE